MEQRERAGRVRIQLFGKNYTATWTLVDGSIEVVSAVGVGTVRVGGLVSAPSIAAYEKLREMVLVENQLKSPKPDRMRFNIKDA